MEEENGCTKKYEGKERRSHCELIIALNTEYHQDKIARDEWRKEVNDKLEAILLFTKKIEPPYNAGLWAFRIAVGTVILTGVGFLIDWIKNNIHIR